MIGRHYRYRKMTEKTVREVIRAKYKIPIQVKDAKYKRAYSSELTNS